VITGLGKIEDRLLTIAVMDFNFIAATMGSVVGEKLTRCVERATERRIPVVIVSASGGARMYEGMLSLLQMAKTSGALALHARARLPFISVLTNPTTGGVTRELCHPGRHHPCGAGAMIGFAGPARDQGDHPPGFAAGFQTAEFLEEHGLIDMIVSRRKLRETLSTLIEYLLPVAA